MGALVLSFTITTVELEMNQLQANEYSRFHQDYAEYLNVGFNQETHQGHIDPLKHRRLWITTLTPALDAVAPKTHVKRLERWF